MTMGDKPPDPRSSLRSVFSGQSHSQLRYGPSEALLYMALYDPERWEEFVSRCHVSILVPPQYMSRLQSCNMKVYIASRVL